MFEKIVEKDGIIGKNIKVSYQRTRGMWQC